MPKSLTKVRNQFSTTVLDKTDNFVTKFNKSKIYMKVLECY